MSFFLNNMHYTCSVQLTAGEITPQCDTTQLGLGERLCPPCSSSLSLYSAAGDADRDCDADRAGDGERDRVRERDRSRSFSLLLSR